MNTEQWALLVSFIAVISSVALPLYFRHLENKEKLSSKKEMLLQTILSVKSMLFMSSFELKYLIEKHRSKMEKQQIEELRKVAINLKKKEEEMSFYQELCNKPNGCKLLKDIEEIHSAIYEVESDLIVISKLITSGKESYEKEI